MNRIGRYEIEGRIGSGGFATVYKVRDTVLDSEVAAKVLAENWTDNAEIRDRFIREAQLLRRIDSHRVVTVHDIGEIEGGQPYFVMSLANRGTLEDRLMANHTSPAPADVIKLAQELAACVRDVHNHDLIHRDIKPSNLLVTGGRGAIDVSQPPLLKEAERLLLGDFGLAKDIALQATGMTIAAGTGGYAAPEQMTLGGDPSRQTDLYAATAVMYRILTGTNPPNYDLLKEIVPFPDGQWWMAGALGQFFNRGMAYEQTARHNSIDTWLADFQQAYGGEQATLPPTTPVVPDSTPRSAFPSVPAITANSDPTSFLPEQRTSPVRAVPTANQPAYQQPSNPITPPPQGYQGPNHGWDRGPGPDPRSVPAVSAPVGAPSGYYPVPTGQPGYGQYPAHHAPQQQARPRRSVLPWLLSILVVAAAAVAGYVLVLPAFATPEVEGPDAVPAGETATFRASFDGADGFRWTDFEGGITDADEFSFVGIVPGPVRFKVQAIDDGSLSRARTVTVRITEGEGAPVIIGPDEIKVGEPTDFRFEAEGATDPEWRIDQVQNSEQITVTGSAAGPIDIVLIVTNAEGDRVGTRRTIQVVP